MDDSSQSDLSKIGEPGGARASAAVSGDTEEIDALPVLGDQPELVHAYRIGDPPATYWRSTSVAIPAVQAAAVAAGGFVAGAALVRLVHRRQRQISLSRARGAGRAVGLASRRKRSSKTGELVQIVGSRSLLLDVHLLAGRD